MKTSALAAANPDIGFVVDAPHADAALVIAFGFASWDALNAFDFDGRTLKLAECTGVALNRILVRDTANFWYQHGVSGLGRDADEVAAALRDWIARLRPRSVSTLGQSMGGYAAILFGALLGADRVLAFGPLSYLRSDWARRDGDTRWLPAFDKLQRFPPARLYDDLPALLAATPRLPAIRVVIGSASAPGQAQNLDRLHAQRLAASAAVSVQEFAQAPHAVVQWLIEQGRIDALLRQWLLPDASALPSPAENAARNAGAPPDDARAAPAFTDAWRSWIAENLALGVAADTLLPTLVEHGLHVGEAQRELDKAARSPYLAPARRLAQRVLKREWVLEAQRKLRPPQPVIERRHRLPRDMFLREYYSANRPVIITGMMDDWPARNWTPEDLAARFCAQQVQVQAGRNANARYEIEGAQHRKTLRFGDFMQQVMHGGESNDIYMTANNVGANAQAMAGLWDGIVQIPEYLDASDPANRGFFWIGPAGTITPTHHDLTNNFMAQILGRKRVRLVDSLQAARIHNSLHVYSDVDLEAIDYARFPAMRAVTVLECDLAPGELLFIPVGWWHHVRSLDISVTVTFVNFLFDNDFSSMYTTYQAV